MKQPNLKHLIRLFNPHRIEVHPTCPVIYTYFAENTLKGWDRLCWLYHPSIIEWCEKWRWPQGKRQTLFLIRMMLLKTSMSCITSFRWWCTGTPNWWSTLIGAKHFTQPLEREYSQWSHVLPVRACWSSMVSSSRWWRSGCPRWRWSPPPPRRHRLLSPSGGSTWRGALKHFQNWLFSSFFLFPFQLLMGTSAVRN